MVSFKPESKGTEVDVIVLIDIQFDPKVFAASNLLLMCCFEGDFEICKHLWFSKLKKIEQKND